ncbi:MAG TPA: response regulator transcription factor [Anaerolineaceae bacterium]|nr:response regulator transcription factor [Anaerolineaceae bacterium]
MVNQTSGKDTQTQNVGIDLDETLRRNKKVLIIDDDPDTIELMKRILRLADFDVASSRNGTEAVTIAEIIQPDIILLDLMMPEVDGRATLKNLREITQSPVIVVSALIDKKNIVDLLNLGSDDYITKPFHRDELVARIQAVLRRARLLSVIDGVSIPESGLTVNFSKREVHFQGEFVQLSPKEYELIELLVKQMPHVVKYKEIGSEIWGENNNYVRNRIKYLVHTIRNKFHEIKPGIDVIVTADRVGYRIQSD